MKKFVLWGWGLITQLLLATPLYAENTLSFKKEGLNSLHWMPYLTVLSVLLIVLMLLAQKAKASGKINRACQVIEKIPVHHKTQLYVIDYQGQRFLIADNQNALAIHPLTEGTSS